MPIEVKKLGLQPKVEMTTELTKVKTPDGKTLHQPTYKAELVDSVEYVATGKEIQDPEFAKLMSDTADHDGAQKEKFASIFGMDRISTPQGGETMVRGDQVELLKSQGYGKDPRTGRMLVPDLPWQRERKVGEPWAIYISRTGQLGRTLVRYADGRKLVMREEGFVIEREAV